MLLEIYVGSKLRHNYPDSVFEVDEDITEEQIWEIIENNVSEWISYRLVEEEEED